MALKGNQGTLHQDVADFFADPVLSSASQTAVLHDAGHGRIEKRTARVAPADWLWERHPEWKGLSSIIAIDAQRKNKKTGKTSEETRFYISSLGQNPDQILAVSRAHWGIENNLHWQLDVTFKEDDSMLKKDHILGILNCRCGPSAAAQGVLRQERSDNVREFSIPSIPHVIWPGSVASPSIFLKGTLRRFLLNANA